MNKNSIQYYFIQLIKPKTGSCLCVQVCALKETTNKVSIWLETDILPWYLKDVMGMSYFKACTKTCFEIWYFLDIFKTPKIEFNLQDIKWKDQQARVGKKLARGHPKCWSIVGEKCWPNIAQRLGQWRPNIGWRLGQRWPNIGLMLSRGWADRVTYGENSFCYSPCCWEEGSLLFNPWTSSVRITWAFSWWPLGDDSHSDR